VAQDSSGKQVLPVWSPMREVPGRIFRSTENREFLRHALCFDLRIENSSTSNPGKAMNHHQLEKDIEHLEHVISHISAEDRIPLSYWRNRINSVSGAALVPSQATRVKRLNAALSALERRQKA
jgi:hypothetical protein